MKCCLNVLIVGLMRGSSRESRHDADFVITFGGSKSCSKRKSVRTVRPVSNTFTSAGETVAARGDSGSSRFTRADNKRKGG